MRALFGWKPGSMRADLKVVLDAGSPGETGFSPDERTMLRNILGLRERRIADVMVPRADIVAVQAGHLARRIDEGVREARRIRASSSTTTRSTIRSAWSTSAT